MEIVRDARFEEAKRIYMMKIYAKRAIEPYRDWEPAMWPPMDAWTQAKHFAVFGDTFGWVTWKRERERRRHLHIPDPVN